MHRKLRIWSHLLKKFLTEISFFVQCKDRTHWWSIFLCDSFGVIVLKNFIVQDDANLVHEFLFG